MKHLAYLLCTSSLLAACADDPVSYSAPVGINLKAKSGDVVAGVVTDEKNINTESGNPYGAFIADARAALGGHDPAAVEIDSLALILGGNSTGVTALDEIFADSIDVLFVMSDSDNSFPVATGTVDGFDVTLEQPTGDDWGRYLDGGFKVVIRGDAAAGFDAAGADADLQLTFGFAAYE